MAFWRVAGFSQPSPIEQILDKGDFTLEELLDEEDVVQECKSLNGRLIAFLRQKKVVELLVRYMVEPSTDFTDAKRQYKYPFTTCEVLCCEVDAIFSTLVDDNALLSCLFSLLAQPPPLSCKTAGYFSRVAGSLLLRKTNEMMSFLRSNDQLLKQLVDHVDTTSVAELIKRLAGADDQAAMLFLPLHTQWLVQTPLLQLLLQCLAPGRTPEVHANAAEILAAIAHAQPSALSAQLMQQDSVAQLMERALEPGSPVLEPALDVCAALLEPRRGQLDPVLVAGGSCGSISGPTSASKPRCDAMRAMLECMPRLVAHLRSTPDSAACSGGGGGEPNGDGAAVVADDAALDVTVVQPTPYGMLAPPLGRRRLRVVELLAALLRVGGEDTDAAAISSGALGVLLDLTLRYPFNNLLHCRVQLAVAASLQRGGSAMVSHLLGPPLSLPAWLAAAPPMVTPLPRPGQAARGPLRAGYIGHVTQMANLLLEASAALPQVAEALSADGEWQRYVAEVLQPWNDVQDVMHWKCGRPNGADGGGGDSSDDVQADMDLRQVQGMQALLYHQLGARDGDANGVDTGDADAGEADDFAASGAADSSDCSLDGSSRLTEAMQGLQLNPGTNSPFKAAQEGSAGSQADADAAGDRPHAGANSSTTHGINPWSLAFGRHLLPYPSGS